MSGAINYTPPTFDGPLPWKTEDGLTPEKAQEIMRAFVRYTHGIAPLCGELRIPSGTAQVYLETAVSIPKHVADGVRRIQRRMKAHYRSNELLKQGAADWNQEKYSYYYESESKAAGEELSVKEKNRNAMVKTGRLFKQARERLKMSQRDIERAFKLSEGLYSGYECSGATPMAEYFFTLCLFYHVCPEELGFVDTMDDRIRDWRRRQERLQAQNAPSAG